MKQNPFETGITFGPVPSRRLGRSLGINNIPPKICSYACVYCQLGNTLKMQIARDSFYLPEDIFKAVSSRVTILREHEEVIDYLAFVPDGEPTLDMNLGKTIDLLKPLGIPIAVISNASLIHLSEVQKDLLKADWVSLKINAADEKLWREIDRPHGKLNHQRILNGMLNFAALYSGKLVTETMLIKGLNDSETAALEIGELLSRLQPDTAYISIPTRPPAEKNIRPASPASINKTWHIFNQFVNSVELLTGYEGNSFSFTGDVKEDILNITSVHPMRQEAIETILAKANSDWDLIMRMLDRGELVQTEYAGYNYYLRRLKYEK